MWKVSLTVQCYKGTLLLRKTRNSGFRGELTAFKKPNTMADHPGCCVLNSDGNSTLNDSEELKLQLHTKDYTSMRRAKNCCNVMLILQQKCLFGNWGETRTEDVWEVSAPLANPAGTW